MVKKYVFILVFVFLLAGVLADFEVEEEDFEVSENYAVGSYISGTIEISFEDQDSSALFTDSFGNKMTLKKVLEESNSYSHDCENNCIVTYSASTPESPKPFTLEPNEERIVGIKYIGRNVGPEKISFNISSNVPEHYKNQLEIDILGDGEIEFGNIGKGSTFGSPSWGCFEKTSQDIIEIPLDFIPFCQKFKLSTAPGFEIGAWIKESTSGDATLKIELVDEYDTLASCELNKTEAGDLSSGKEVFCSIDYVVEEDDNSDYYLCLRKGSGTGSYKVQGYPTINGCGFKGSPENSEAEDNAYHIGFKRNYFGEIKDINYKDFDSGGTMNKIIDDYLDESYNKSYCLPDGCFVPINFISKQSSPQTITLEDLYLFFDYAGGPYDGSGNFYDLEEKYPKINSEMGSLSINNLFPIGNETGDVNYELFFNGEKIIDQNILIEDLDIYLSPMISASGFPTEYKIYTPEEFVPVSYEWNFGNSVEPSSYDKRYHTFNSIGDKTVTVSVSNNQGQKFTESFRVIVEPPEKMIDRRIAEFDQNIVLLKAQMDKYTSFEKSQVEKTLNLTEIEWKVDQIKTMSNQSERENETINLILNLEVPRIIRGSGTGLPYFPNKNLIDESIIQGITEYDGEVSNQLEEAIASWNQENLEVKVSRREFSKSFGGSVGYLMTIFEVEATEIGTVEDIYYLIIEDLDGLEFEEGFVLTEGPDYWYTEVTGDMNFAFVVEEDIDTFELPLYFSPSIDALPVLEIDPIDPFEDNFIIILVLIFAGLILIGIVIYVVLQRWYKVKYEKSLFKDRNYLFNMITYVNNSKKQGLDNSTIKKNLKKVGWNPEQIRYVMRKYTGKKTGMPSFSSSPRKLLKEKMQAEKKVQANSPKTTTGTKGGMYYPKGMRPSPQTKKQVNSRANPTASAQKPNNKYQNTINNFRNSVNKSQGNNNFKRKNNTGL